MQTNQLITTDRNGDSFSVILRKEGPALERLLPEHRKMIEAGLRPTLSRLQVMDALDVLTDVVNMAYSISGQKPDMETVAITVNELYTRVMERYPHCTMEEVRTAIRNGVFDEYGEYFGLNVKTFVMFIREYLFSEQRKAAKAAFEAARKKANQPKEVEQPYWENNYWTEERIDQWQDITENCYRWFCEDSVLGGFIQEGSYWLLKRSGAIAITDGYRTELIERAKQAARAELVKNEDKKHISEIKETLEQLKSLDEYPDLKRQVHYTAKKLAVMDYFHALRKKEKKSIFK